MSEAKTMDFFLQICEGYQELHWKKILHRDLKPENILMHKGVVKIGDFGFSRINEKVDEAIRMTKKCTPIYGSY